MSAEDWIPDFGDYKDYKDCEDCEEVQCKFCGAEGLEWSDTGGRWVLIDCDGKEHRCDPAREAIDRSDEFDDLS